MAMDEWNTRIHYICITCPVPKPRCFPRLDPWPNLGTFPRCMSRMRSCWQWLRKHVQPQSNGVSCYRNCLSWSSWVTRICNDLYGMSKLGKYEAMIRNVFFLWGGGCEDGYIISGWCQMGNSITEICKISGCFWMAGQPTPPLLPAYELLVSLNKAFLNPYFWGWVTWGGGWLINHNDWEFLSRSNLGRIQLNNLCQKMLTESLESENDFNLEHTHHIWHHGKRDRIWTYWNDNDKHFCTL